jgi:hypothetical protein
MKHDKMRELLISQIENVAVTTKLLVHSSFLSESESLVIWEYLAKAVNVLTYGQGQGIGEAEKTVSRGESVAGNAISERGNV